MLNLIYVDLNLIILFDGSVFFVYNWLIYLIDYQIRIINLDWNVIVSPDNETKIMRNGKCPPVVALPNL